MSYAPIATLSAIGVTPTRPETEVSSGPLKPGVTENSSDPLALASPWTSAGAETTTARSAIGERTACVPSAQVSDPIAHSPNSASVRENVTVNSPVAPGARVSCEGVTCTSNPGTLADAL